MVPYVFPSEQDAIRAGQFRMLRLWRSMRQRCDNPRHPSYEIYGARGITICDRWHNFANFYVDMSPHPGAGWTIERIDNNRNYEPGNCQWATMLEQNHNQRSTVRADKALEIKKFRDKTGWSTTEIAKVFGCSQATVWKILHDKHWTTSRV